MTATAPAQFKITYTSANVDWELFHRQFDEALARVRAQLGRDYALHIGGEAVVSGAAPIVDTSPIDTGMVLGRFAAATSAHVDRAVTAAKAAQTAWAKRGWRARVATLHAAASLIRERKFELAAIMALEVGKSRLESMGDAEESADLIDYYCQELEDANGFVRQMAKVTAVERNTDVLRPYGVFACIAPFNFPLALSTGMSAAALMTGNAVVYKPAGRRPVDRAQAVRGVPGCRRSAGGIQLYPGHRGGHGGGTVAAPGHRRRRLHGVEGGGDAYSPRPLPPMDQAVPARDGREERRDRHGLGGPGCGGGRDHTLRVRAAEPEVQRHVAGLRASARRQGLGGEADREDENAEARRPDRAGRVLRSRNQRGGGRAFRACRDAGAAGGDGPRGRGSSRQSRRPTRRSTASRRASSRRGLRRSSASSTRSKPACVT